MLQLQTIRVAESQFSGPDFPKLIQTFKEMGMVKHTVSLETGLVTYTDFSGDTLQQTGYRVQTPIALSSDKVQVQLDLSAHQADQMTFPEFCEAMAKAGVAYWVSDLENMRCTYFDRSDHGVFSEDIPQI